MQMEIKEIQRQLGVTTIFVTHDQSEALSLSDRIAVMFEGRIRQVGSPDEIYRRPADRFVASFVGDVNVLRGRLHRADNPAIVALGAARISVPAEPLARVRSGDRVDLFVRPEQMRFANSGEPIALEGTVAAHIYQGGYVNLYLEAPEVCTSRLLIRSLEPDAINRWPTGTRVGVTIAGADVMAFEPEPAIQSV
jgi:putative spermidine/putrescine transport system ATP-binding protein/spermidine/putrescine transport system ATP-binding protein